MSRNSSGKAFEREFNESLGSFKRIHPEFWYMRWPDYRDWIVVNPKLFAPKAPCDYVSVCRGTFYAFELKSTRGPRFSLDWLKDHQREHLLDVSSAGGRAFIIFSTRLPTLRATAISIEDYMMLEQETIYKGQKSIKASVLLDAGIKLDRGRDGSPWSLKELFALGDDA